jgi:hypothetical protein
MAAYAKQEKDVHLIKHATRDQKARRPQGSAAFEVSGGDWRASARAAQPNENKKIKKRPLPTLLN